jgi:dinuclear metal center YbgI/SA1388 family protein
MPINRNAFSPILQQFISQFETKIASLSLAGSWDNVGLLIEPLKIRNTATSLTDLSVFLTIDLTNTVLTEAIQGDCNLIITYHPILFTPTQSVTPLSQHIAATALSHGIAVFSPHTALDSMSGGINDFFLSQTLGSREFSDLRRPCLLERDTPVGRIAQLRDAVSLRDLVAEIKALTGRSMLRVALPLGRESEGLEVDVKSVAFCAGSGGSVIKGGGADCVVTGELSHHEILAHTSAGRAVILTEHSNCERPFLGKLKDLLEDRLGLRKVVISQLDDDPVRFF